MGRLAAEISVFLVDIPEQKLIHPRLTNGVNTDSRRPTMITTSLTTAFATADSGGRGAGKWTVAGNRVPTPTRAA